MLEKNILVEKVSYRVQRRKQIRYFNWEQYIFFEELFFWYTCLSRINVFALQFISSGTTLSTIRFLLIDLKIFLKTNKKNLMMNTEFQVRVQNLKTVGSLWFLDLVMPEHCGDKFWGNFLSNVLLIIFHWID